MSRTVIKVEGLGKEYVIGGRESGNETFREMLASSRCGAFPPSAPAERQRLRGGAHLGAEGRELRGEARARLSASSAATAPASARCSRS